MAHIQQYSNPFQVSGSTYPITSHSDVLWFKYVFVLGWLSWLRSRVMTHPEKLVANEEICQS